MPVVGLKDKVDKRENRGKQRKATIVNNTGKAVAFSLSSQFSLWKK